MTTSVATAASSVPRTFSLGPVKVQVFDVPLISGNTVVTVTADTMTTALWAILSAGVTQTAAPTYATNVATFTITDPAATVKAQAIILGV